MHSIYLNAYYIHIYIYAPLSSLFEDMQHISTLVLLFSLCICGVYVVYDNVAAMLIHELNYLFNTLLMYVPM